MLKNVQTIHLKHLPLQCSESNMANGKWNLGMAATTLPAVLQSGLSLSQISHHHYFNHYTVTPAPGQLQRQGPQPKQGNTSKGVT